MSAEHATADEPETGWSFGGEPSISIDTVRLVPDNTHLRVTALQLAIQSGPEPPDTTVARAKAYERYLSGEATDQTEN